MKPRMDTNRHECGDGVRQDLGQVRQIVCFNARTEAQGTRGEGAFNFRLIDHFCMETGPDETKEYGV